VVAAAEGLTAREEDRRTPCPLWTVRDLLTHLWCTAERYHDLLDDAVADAPQRLVVNWELAEMNAAAIRRCPPVSTVSLVTSFRRSAVDYLHRALGHWDVAPYQKGAAASVGQMCCVAAIEWHVHAWDLEVARGRAYRSNSVEAATMRSSWLSAVPHLSIPEAGDAWLAVLGAAERRVGAGTVGTLAEAPPIPTSWTPWDAVPAEECDPSARSFYSRTRGWRWRRLTLRSTFPPRRPAETAASTRL
jgi:hypothetical protein